MLLLVISKEMLELLLLTLLEVELREFLISPQVMLLGKFEFASSDLVKGNFRKDVLFFVF